MYDITIMELSFSRHEAPASSMPMPLLRQDILAAPIIPVNGYQFRAFSVGERGTMLQPELIQEVRDGLVEQARRADRAFESIVSIHTTGAVWATLAAAELRVPVHFFVPTPSYIDGQKKLVQTTGYDSRAIYTPDMTAIGNCLIIDDVLSTGSTLRMMVDALREAGANPVGVVCVVDKGGMAETMERELGLPVRALADAQQVLSESAEPIFSVFDAAASFAPGA